MKVISIRSRQFLGGYMSQSAESVWEWAGFLTRMAVPVFVPTLLYCVISTQWWPLYVMSTVVTTGSMAGIAKFYWLKGDYLQRIFGAGIPSIPRGARIGGLKKAA